MSTGETPLTRILKDLISEDGPLPVARYMELCLGHPEHGYYQARDPFGRGGDFITAPEVSQMFGELIGVWCIDAWTAMDQPASLQLIELGPGRGTLMADILRTLQSISGFPAALDVHLVETSPALTARQKKALAQAGFPVRWHERLETVPPAPSLVIANEFFDALPVTQYEFRGGHWHERCVGAGEGGELCIGLSPEPLAPDGLNLPDMPVVEGCIWELSPARAAVAHELGRRIGGSGGAGLIVDYGHTEPGFGDTLQAVRAHEPVAVTSTPGDADLTSHVDFHALGQALSRAGAQVHPPISQGAFLTQLGIPMRADILKKSADENTRAEIDAATERLIHCDQMGNLFKVCAFTARGMRPPFPFGGGADD